MVHALRSRHHPRTHLIRVGQQYLRHQPAPDLHRPRPDPLHRESHLSERGMRQLDAGTRVHRRTARTLVMQASCGLVILTVACALSLKCIAAAEPITVRDAFDRVVTLLAPPQRIVTIFASNTEMVAALGLADRIVGIEAYTRYPPEILDRPLVGGRLGFSVDAVAGLRPDLVVVTPARQAAHQLVDPMERIGVPIIVLMQRSVAEIFANIRLLGRVAGVPDRGEEVARDLEAR